MLNKQKLHHTDLHFYRFVNNGKLLSSARQVCCERAVTIETVRYFSFLNVIAVSCASFDLSLKQEVETLNYFVFKLAWGGGEPERLHIRLLFAS